ncbi:MAG: hypothetical protein R3C39_10075 [Dehalococcoidia bacterium]
MKKFFAVGLIASIGAMALASAAALGTLGGASLGAADAEVTACDTDGFDVSYTTSFVDGTGYVVDSVDLSGLDGACDGLTAYVTLTDDFALATAITDADGSATVAGGAATVALTTAPPAVDVTDVHVLITEPPAP